MKEFVAIDFETANGKRASACSVGMAAFDANGQVSATYYQLLRPHPSVDYFQARNTGIHGITAADVAGSPYWSDIRPAVLDFIGDRVLVAHNMAFDGSVLNSLALAYGHENLINPRMCTLKIARAKLCELPKHRLNLVFDHYFPGEKLDHHLASADAEACGRIFARMQTDYAYEDLEVCGTQSPTPGSRARQEPRYFF
ncbi:exonuclease domain-containing protein [Corynebacterium phocae]|uniref:exonuclease domain-containing protein n=1 Tax=Corynebacterium phocae TaxID=161895 RepID=UPI0009529627|nr:exonuclease domain-containing protein [Corynebacterium phocae]KAA8726930.1 hypothetical protein F4V58_01910 [Corynebacterium phocae]